MKIRILAAILLLAIQFKSEGAAIIYVKANAAGSNNGSSWADAFTDLQAGIGATSPGDQLWVAAGTYKPTTTTDRNISFNVPTGVAMYGGFAGTETQLAQRNWVLNETILSGDIGTTGTANDNTYYVVYAHNVASNTRFDGFKVVNGYGYYFTSNLYGSGIVINNGSMTIENCTFTANHSDDGGVISHTTGGGPTTGVLNIINCNIVNNTSNYTSALFLRGTQCNIRGCNISGNEGAEAVWIDDGACIMDRCIISGNNSNTNFATVTVGDANATMSVYNSLFVGNLSTGGAAFEIRAANPNNHIFWNCTVAGNKSTASGSSSCALTGNTTTSFRNCIIWGNTNKQFYYNSSEDVQNCIVQGGYTGTGNSSSDPLFVNPGNVAQAPFTADAYDYRLQSSSPGINGGNNTYTSNFYNLDLNDSARISANVVDQGCYEKQFCSATVSITSSGTTNFCNGGFVTLTASQGSTYLWSNAATSPSIAAATQGTYTVTVIDGNGCYGTASQLVNVYPASVTITGDNTICNGGTTTLTASSPNGSIFSWSTGATTSGITVAQAGTYTVTVTTVNSCSAVSSPVVVTAVTVNPAVITQNGNMLTSSVSGTYQWYLNGNAISGATGQSYTPVQNGSYTVIVSNNGCTAAASNAIDVTNTGIEEMETGGFSVYPNPAGNLITIETESATGYYQVGDVTGKIILTGPVTSNKFFMDISHFCSGVYYLTISNNDKSQHRVFIKE